MEIVVGTYEELILSYRIKTIEKVPEFSLSFTDHSHTGCVRTVAASERGFLASGSSDESIRLFSLKKHREIGSLMHHNGMITSIVFHGKSHMFSTSADGTIGIWLVGKWECLKTLRGHKGAVNHISVHPTGKMALSVGCDKTLRIWDLITAKCAYISNLKQAGDLVLWAPDGNTYIVVTNNSLDVYDVKTAKVTGTIKARGRINAVQYLKPNTVIIGGEEGMMEVHHIGSMSQLLSISTNTTRIKGLVWISEQSQKTDGEFTIVSVSSDGLIKLWLLKESTEDNWEYTLLGETQTKFRLTSVAVYSPRIVEDKQTQADPEESEVKMASSDTDQHHSKLEKGVESMKTNKRKRSKKTTGNTSPKQLKVDTSDDKPTKTKSKTQKQKKKSSRK